MHIQIFHTLRHQKKWLSPQPELHIYFCNTTLLIGPLSVNSGDGIVQVNMIRLRAEIETNRG